ncbi:HD domain-containing protein [Treponema pedis]|uniref:HD domain-containing protein n=1 Tax=Treponema pedis TaxID=409322 RepID=A0A7S6WM66_9SPIR|nr:HD domain-containing protein [Treponema pedis]QOW59728.1 HD domain-containing protein [Treponema pedis]
MIFTNKTVLKIFEAFSIQRWNDLIRPFDIVEMDKTAEKAFLAFIIGKYEEKNGANIDWEIIIDGLVFELLRKIALCDIKAPVQRRIRKDYPEEYKKINEWIFEKYSEIIEDGEFKNGFKNFLSEKEDNSDITKRVLKAAHRYSTIREFEMLKPVNEPFRLTELDSGLKKEMSEFMDLTAVKLLFTHQIPHKFLTEIEKLRFQIRWNQTPRVPATTVLGHSFFVASLTLLMCYDLNIKGYRKYNNFFSALFHDLPEAVTRDIISPVKQATNHLPEVVKEIEQIIVGEELLPLMDSSFKDEVMFYIQNEFENRILLDGQVTIVSFEELNGKYSSEKYKPTDGKLVRVADQIAAFVEADSSIRYGITSAHLQTGKKNIMGAYPIGTRINNFNTDSFFNAYR